MKKKVLFILHLPPPVHGASMVGKYIKESQAINNFFDTHYINLSTSNSLYQIGKAGIGKLIIILKIQIKILKALISKKYDLFYITIACTAPGFYKDFLVVAILKLFRRKIIYHLHNKGISARQSNIIDHLLNKLVFNNTKVILLSPLLYYDIEKYVKKENVYFCPNGIPKNANLSLDKKVIDNNIPVHLLFLSNMMVVKGVFVLLEACKLLKEKSLCFKCDFVGEWFDISKEEFNTKVFSYDLTDHVFAYGGKYGKDKYPFFNQADIFVFPTYNEAFGLVCLEAMEFGLPIISTPEGSIPEVVIDGETGYLVPRQNATALAEKIELLINQPEIRVKMGIAGRNRFDALFTIDKFENRLTDILHQAINSGFTSSVY